MIIQRKHLKVNLILNKKFATWGFELLLYGSLLSTMTISAKPCRLERHEKKKLRYTARVLAHKKKGRKREQLQKAAGLIPVLQLQLFAVDYSRRSHEKAVIRRLPRPPLSLDTVSHSTPSSRHKFVQH